MLPTARVRGEVTSSLPRGQIVRDSILFPAGADKKAEAGAGSATEFQFVSISCLLWVVTGFVGSGV